MIVADLRAPGADGGVTVGDWTPGASSATNGLSLAAIAVSAVGESMHTSAAGQASAEAYLADGDRMAGLMDGVWKLCVGLIVLVVVTWARGLLPVAVRLS